MAVAWNYSNHFRKRKSHSCHLSLITDNPITLQHSGAFVTQEPLFSHFMCIRKNSLTSWAETLEEVGAAPQALLRPPSVGRVVLNARGVDQAPLGRVGASASRGCVPSLPQVSSRCFWEEVFWEQERVDPRNKRLKRCMWVGPSLIISSNNRWSWKDFSFFPHFIWQTSLDGLDVLDRGWCWMLRLFLIYKFISKPNPPKVTRFSRRYPAINLSGRYFLRWRELHRSVVVSVHSMSDGWGDSVKRRLPEVLNAFSGEVKGEYLIGIEVSRISNLQKNTQLHLNICSGRIYCFFSIWLFFPPGVESRWNC